MKLRTSSFMEDESGVGTSKSIKMNDDAGQQITERQSLLLTNLVICSRAPAFDSGEPFVAVRVGLAGITIMHPESDPLVGAEMADLDRLGDLGLLDLQRLPSGVRSFSVTEAGFLHATEDSR